MHIIHHPPTSSTDPHNNCIIFIVKYFIGYKILYIYIHQHHTWFYVALGTEPRASGMLSKHSISDYAKSPNH